MCVRVGVRVGVHACVCVQQISVEDVWVIASG